MPDPVSSAFAPREPSGAGDLATRLRELHARFPACDIAAVTEVVRAVLASMTGPLSGADMSLLAEVQELGDVLARTRAEIAAMQVEDITLSHIPAASDELEAILTHTAGATHAILEVCEQLDGLADGLDRPARAGPTRAAAAEVLRGATMRVYEACGFQDLTGQRISKVVLALQAIDARITRILQASGAGPRGVSELVEASLAAADLASEEARAASLLRGPQLPEAAMGQSAIDELLAAF